MANSYIDYVDSLDLIPVCDRGIVAKSEFAASHSTVMRYAEDTYRRLGNKNFVFDLSLGPRDVYFGECLEFIDDLSRDRYILSKSENLMFKEVACVMLN